MKTLCVFQNYLGYRFIPQGSLPNSRKYDKLFHHILCVKGCFMCGLCGLIEEQQEWSDHITSDLPKRQNRFRKIKIINQMLHYHRVKVSDVHGVNYLLQTPTGKQGMANGLNLLWDEFAALTGKRMDVLDPKLLSALADEGDGAFEGHDKI